VGVKEVTFVNLVCAESASGNWPAKEKFLELKKVVGNKII